MIEQALQALDAQERSASAYTTATVANLAVAIARFNGDKDLQSKDFDVVVMLNNFERARDMLDRHQAQVILELSTEGKIPSWVLRELDIDLIRMAAK